jgi:hypothetical protein
VRNNGDAFGVIEDFFRNAFVGSGHDFMQDGACVLKPIGSCLARGICPAKRSQAQYGT